MQIQTQISHITRIKNLPELLTWLGVFLALGYILTFIILAMIRLFYPYELEWIEGAFLDEVRWILAGHFPYGPPSIYFVPTSKTPFFFYLSAFLAKLIGVSFIAPRTISVLSTLGCFLLLFLVVKKETGQPAAGVCAAGLYAACFRFAGAWMDIAKTDSLVLLLILMAFFTYLKYPGRKGMVISGLLFALAYYTKQIALPVILVLATISIFLTRGRSWLQWVSTILSGGLAFLFFEKLSAGWFSFYTIRTIASHQYVPDYFQFWKLLIPKLWPIILIGLIYAGSVIKNTRPLIWKWPESSWLNLGIGTALILASWSVNIKVWTYDNGFMPACLGISLIAGLGFGELLKKREKLPITISKIELPFSLFWLIGTIILALQFWLLRYNPIAQLPTASDRRAGDAFISLMKNLDGEVYVYNHGYLSSLAGKTTYLHSSPLGDILGGKPPLINSDMFRREELIRQLFKTALSKQLFTWVILDTPNKSWLPYYIYTGNIFNEANTFFPVTGVRIRPESLLVKNPIARGGILPLNDPNLETLFMKGWSQPQTWGRWMILGEAILQVALEQGKPYDLVLNIQPSCTDQPPDINSIRILWNGESIGDYMLRSCNQQSILFRIPKDAIKKEMNLVSFIFTNPVTNELSASLRVTSVNFIQK